MVRQFKLHYSETLRIGDKDRKGYKREWFEKAWATYCSPSQPPLPVDPVDTLTPQGMQADRDPLTDSNVNGSDSGAIPFPIRESTGSTGSGADHGDDGSDYEEF